MRLRTKVCCCVTLLAGLLHADPAHAWFGWLDELSGPGPFWGYDFDFRVVCFMDQPSTDDAFRAHVVASQALAQLPANPQSLVLETALALPAGLRLPPGLTLPEGLTLSRDFVLPPGQLLPAHFNLPAGLVLPIGLILPAGLIFNPGDLPPGFPGIRFTTLNEKTDFQLPEPWTLQLGLSLSRDLTLSQEVTLSQPLTLSQSLTLSQGRELPRALNMTKGAPVPANWLPKFDAEIRSYFELKQPASMIRNSEFVRTLIDAIECYGCRERRRATVNQYKRVEDLTKESEVPTVTAPGAALGYFERCDNKRRREHSTVAIEPRHRHQSASLLIDYRTLTNTSVTRTGNPLNVLGQFKAPFVGGAISSGDRNEAYANAQSIQLHLLEAKLSWPLTGRFDVIDGQAGAGVYWFSSKGFVDGGTPAGFVFEPVKFDFHVPGRWFDSGLLSYQGKTLAGKTGTFFLRLAPSLSFNAGLLMFPAGFSATQFNAIGLAARSIPGSEVVFQSGVALNVGRVLSGIKTTAAGASGFQNRP